MYAQILMPEAPKLQDDDLLSFVPLDNDTDNHNHIQWSTNIANNMDSVAINLDSTPDFLRPFPAGLEPTPVRTVNVQVMIAPEVGPSRTARMLDTSNQLTSQNVKIHSTSRPSTEVDNNNDFKVPPNVTNFGVTWDFDSLLACTNSDSGPFDMPAVEFDMDSDISVIGDIDELEPTEIIVDDGARHVKRWPEQYCDLVAFHRIHGHSDVTPDNDRGFPKLLQWVKRQRYLYKLLKSGKPSSMTQRKLELLQKVDFIWNIHDAVWEARFQELIAYRREHGHCNVPRDDRGNKKLSCWVKRQRGEYSKKCLSPHRIERLEDIGFIFDILNHRAVQRHQVLM